MAKNKKKPKKKVKAKKELPGISLEKAVARIQQMMDKESRVTHNETLVDRLGNKRQFDVVIRGSFAGRSILGVVECKDHNRRKGPAEVEAFAKKTEHLGANLRMMVSKKGFSKQGLVVARHEFISCFSLLTEEFVGDLNVGHFWYGTVGLWTDASLEYRFIGRALGSQFSYEEVLWNNAPVTHWVLNELFSKYASNDPGKYKLTIVFPIGVEVLFRSATYKLKELIYLGALTQIKKRKWVSWKGDALFDWDKNQIHIPGGVQICGSAVEMNMATWDDYDGEIPTKPDGNGILILARGRQHFPDYLPIPDLGSLNPVCEILAIP